MRPLHSSFFFLALFYIPIVSGTTASWTGPDNGEWITPANWNPTTVPNAIDDTAQFALAANRTINLNSVSAQNVTLGTMSFTDANTYTIQSGLAGNSLIFDVSSSNATITVSNSGSKTLSCPITLNDPLIAQVNTGTLTLSGIISGSSTLTKTGTSTLTCSGAASNTLTGNVVLSAGTLQLNKNAGLTAFPGNVQVDGGTLLVSGTNQTIGSLTFNAGTYTATAATLNLTASGTALTMRNTTLNGNIQLTGGGQVIFDDTDGGTATINGNIDLGGAITTFLVDPGVELIDMAIVGTISNGGVTKASGGGTALGFLRFLGTNPNTYTGLTSMMGGNLGLTKPANVVAIPGDVLIVQGRVATNNSNQFGPTSVMTLTAGTFDLLSTTQTLAGLSGNGTVLLGTGTLVINNTNLNTFSGSITGTTVAGSNALVLGGNSTFTLSGTANTYTGITQISSGTLQAGVSNSLSTTSLHNINSGATLDINSTSQSILSLTGSGNITLGTGTLSISSNTGSPFPGAITGTTASGANALVLPGSGTFVLSGNANSYRGITLINSGGILQAGIANTFSANSIHNVASGATLDLNDTNQSVGGLQGTGVVDLGTATLTLNNTANSSFGGTLTADAASGVVIKTGASIQTLTNPATYFVSTTISQGTLQSGVNSTFPNVPTTITSGATLDLQTFSQTLSTVSGTGAITTGTGSVLTLAEPVNTTISTPISGSGAVTKTGAGVLTFAGSNTYTGLTTVSVGTLQAQAATNNVFSASSIHNVASGATLNVNNTLQTIGGLQGAGAVTLGGGTLTLNTAANSTFSGTISTAGSLTKTGVATQTLSGANSYTGSTTISNGTLQVGITNAIPTASATSIAGGATLDILPTFSQSLSNISGTGAVTLGTGSTLNINNGSGVSFSGPISGTGAVTKTSAGDLTLFGTNSYSGGTTISAGRLIGNTTSLQGTITNNSNIQFNQTTNGSFAGTVTGSGNLEKIGAGILTLPQASTYSGTTAISVGTLQIGILNAIPIASATTIVSGATLDLQTFSQTLSTVSGTGAITTGTGSVLTLAEPVNTTISTPISGSGAVTKTGAGVLTFAGSNTYTGLTTVSVGTLQAQAATNNVFSASSIHNVASGATLNVNNTLQTIGGLQGAGAVTLGGGTLTLNTAANSTYSGTISTAGSLTKTGAATQTLSGANSYTGSTTISNGTLQVGITNAIPTASATSIAGGATLDIQPTFSQSLSSITGSGAVTLGTGSTLNINNGSGVSFSGPISGAGAVTKTSAGDLTLLGTNSYSGGTTISAGRLIGNATSLQGAITNNSNLQFNQTTNGSFAGSISGSGNLEKIGAGILTLSQASTYSGTTTISTGTLQVGITNAIPTASATTIASGATLDILPTFSQSLSNIAGTGAVTVGTGGTLNINNSSAISFSGPISGAGAVTKTSGGDLTLLGTNSYSGGTTISAGRLIGNATSLQGAIINNSNLQFNQTTNGSFAGSISGSGNLEKIGAGILTLSQASTYSGTTTISTGTLQVGITNAIPTASTTTIASGATLDILPTFSQSLSDISGTGAVTVGTGGTLNINNSTPSSFSGPISGAGAVTKTSAGDLTLLGTNTYSGGTTISAGRLIGNTTSLQGAITNNSNLQFNQTTNGSFSGSISGSGNLEKIGAGILTLPQASTYSGATTISVGTLQVGITNAIPTASATTIASGATLDIQPTFSQSLSDISGTGAVTVGTGGTFNINNSTPSSFSGPISGTGAVTKTSAGDLTLLGTNTYSGGTTISAGRLIGNTTSLQGAITNNSNLQFNQTTNGSFTESISGSGNVEKIGTGILTLAQASTYSGTTTISAGTLQVGITNAIPTASATTIASGATLDIQPTFSQSLSDISGTGAVTVGTGGTFNINNSTPSSFSGPISGTGAVTKTSAGDLTLLGTNTYSGGTTISTGRLIGNTTSLQGAITNNSNLQFDQPTNGSFIGSISGSGNVEKIGAGILTLPQASTYSGTTTVSNGTLQAGANFVFSPNSTTNVASGATLDVANTSQLLSNLSGSGAVTLGTGTLTINNSVTDIFLGAITGTTAADTNALVITGSSTFTLGGNANSYTGRTDVASGVLQAGTENAFSAASTHHVTGGATLDLNNFNTTTGGLTGSGNVTLGVGTLTVQNTVSNNLFSGVISGTGSLIKNGNAILILSGPNTYSGLTNIVSGTLQGEAINTFSSASTVVVASGTTLDLNSFNQTIAGLQGLGAVTLGSATLTVDNTGADTFSGVITGAGSLTKEGVGTLILNGPNTYSGGTFISGGTLQGNTTSLQGNIIDNANLVFDQTFSGTYASSISGTGTFLKQGGGTLTLSNGNPISGLVTVSEGKLVVNGTLGNGGGLTVASGAILAGIGTITKDAAIYGTLSPGNSIGTIHLVGAQTLASGSTLQIELNPVTSDLVDITGTIAIQPGAALEIMPDPGAYTIPFSYTIINTTGGVTGTFSEVRSTLPLFSGSVVYTPFDVLLELLLPTFSSLGVTGNAVAVAHCLDALSAHPGSDLAFILDNLRMINTVDGIENALIQMQPSAFTALAIAQENDTLYVRNAINNRMEEYIHTCFENQQMSDREMSVWVTPLIAHTSQHRTKQEPGFVANSPGVFIGLDRSFGHGFRIGGGTGYTYTHLDWTEGRGKAHAQSVYGSLYGKFGGRLGYLESSLIGGYNFYSVSRHIQFGSINRHAKSRHEGMEGAVDVKGALTFARKGTVFSPFISIDYLYLHEKRFKETGAGSLNLNVQSKNSSMLVSEGGFDLSHCFNFAEYTLTPFIQLSAIRESRYQGRHEKSSFQGGCYMDVTGLYPTRTLAGISAGLNATLSKTSFSAIYNGRYGKNFKDTSFYFQTRVAF